MRNKRKYNIKSFLVLLLILLLLIAAINLNRNLLLVNKHINDTNLRIHTLEQKLHILDARYAKAYAYQTERINEIENKPVESITYIEEIETKETTDPEEMKQPTVNPTVWIVTLLTGLKAIVSPLRLVY